MWFSFGKLLLITELFGRYSSQLIPAKDDRSPVIEILYLTNKNHAKFINFVEFIFRKLKDIQNEQDVKKIMLIPVCKLMGYFELPEFFEKRVTLNFSRFL